MFPQWLRFPNQLTDQTERVKRGDESVRKRFKWHTRLTESQFPIISSEFSSAKWIRGIMAKAENFCKMKKGQIFFQLKSHSKQSNERKSTLHKIYGLPF